MANDRQYVVGNGLYCEEVGRYATFAEALEHYRRLTPPHRGEWRAIGLWNEERIDVDDSTGLTDEEFEAVNDAFGELL